LGGSRRFYFRLALALGCTVHELLERVSSAELTEWLAFDRVEPIGAWRGDYNFAMLAALYANANRKKGSKPFKTVDFMPVLPDNDPGGEAKALAMFQMLAAQSAAREAEDAAKRKG
jgi:hypothetical protein